VAFGIHYVLITKVWTNSRLAWLSLGTLLQSPLAQMTDEGMLEQRPLIAGIAQPDFDEVRPTVTLTIYFLFGLLKYPIQYKMTVFLYPFFKGLNTQIEFKSVQLSQYIHVPVNMPTPFGAPQV
jgi:hypothetical protein